MGSSKLIVSILFIVSLFCASWAGAQTGVGPVLPGQIKGTRVYDNGTWIGDTQLLDFLNNTTLSRSGNKITINGTARSVNVRDYINCSVTTDNRAAVAALVATGGAAAGKTLFIPSGCKIGLSNYSSGTAAITVASNTTIECEDSTAGFVLGRKVCVGGDSPGAACDSTANCAGTASACTADYGSVAFADNSGSTYTVMDAEASSRGQAIRKCGFWTEQENANSITFGGTGAGYGYCPAGTNAGKSCYQYCSLDNRVQCFGANQAAADAICSAFSAGTCTNYAHCDGASPTPSTCASVPPSTNFAPSGKGKVNVIDFNNATNAVISEVNVYGHRRGDFDLKVGTGGYVSKFDNTKFAAGTDLPWRESRAVATGAYLSFGSTMVDSTVKGWDFAVDAYGATIIGSSTADYGNQTMSGWKGTVGIQVSYPYTVMTGNLQTNFICLHPKGGVGYNYMYMNNYCDGGLGPKVILESSGNQVQTNRFAWGSPGAVISILDNRGYCSGGTRSGLLCTTTSGIDENIGCPGSTCAATGTTDFLSGGWSAPTTGASATNTRGGGINHVLVNDNLFFSSVSSYCDSGARSGLKCTLNTTDGTNGCGAGATCGDADGCCVPLSTSQIVIAPGKRCAGGTRVGSVCTTDNTNATTGCPGAGSQCDPTLTCTASNTPMSCCTGPGTGTGCTGCCAGLIAVNSTFNDNLFLNLRVNDVGINLDSTGIVDAGAISNLTMEGNLFQSASVATGIKFPATAANATNLTVSGNAESVAVPILNWVASMGEMRLSGLTTTDEQGIIAIKTAGGTITRGRFVKQDTTTDNRVVEVGFSEGDDALGVAMESGTSGTPVRIMLQGYTQCLSDTGSITKGQLLRVTNAGDASSPVAGQVVASSLASDIIVAVADENDGAADALFRCVVRSPAVMNSSTSPFTNARRTSDSSALTNDNTLNDDTQLTVAVSASKNYLIDGVLFVAANATSPDLLVALNTPASPTAINVGFVGGDTPAIGSYQSADNTAGSALQIPNGTTAIYFGGVLENGTNAGNLVVAWSQNTNNGQTVTVKRGSYIRIQELP